MQGGQFPASAANSLIQGYCEDFVSFAAVLAQTLEQVSMRGIDLKQSRTDLERIENGMRNLAEAIHDLLQRQPGKGSTKVTERAADKATGSAAAGPSSNPNGNAATKPSPAPAPAPAAASPSPSQKPATPPKAPTPTPSAPPASPTSANTAAKTPSTPNQGTVRVDMRPRDEAVADSKPAAPTSKTNAPNANAPTASNAPASTPANTAAAASPTPPTPQAPTAAASANAGTAPTPAAASAPPAPGRPVGTAPANRAKAAAPGSGPRPANATAPAQRPGQRPTKRPENLKGTNRSMPLLSVMQFLGRMRKRGTMKVLLPGETLTFDIENGCVMSATSSACPRDERLGDILCDMDICCREQLEPLELLVESGQAAERFGQLVIEHQLATDQQVVAALEAQVRTRFSRACKHLEASYEFVEGERTSTPPAFPVQPLPIA